MCVWAEKEVPGVPALLPKQATLRVAMETVLWFNLLQGTYTPYILFIINYPVILSYWLYASQPVTIFRIQWCFPITPCTHLYLPPPSLFFSPSFSAGVPEEARPQAGSGLLPPETSPAPRQVPAATQGSVQLSQSVMERHTMHVSEIWFSQTMKVFLPCWKIVSLKAYS